jgi:hypothetical protein
MPFQEINGLLRIFADLYDCVGQRFFREFGDISARTLVAILDMRGAHAGDLEALRKLGMLVRIDQLEFDLRRGVGIGFVQRFRRRTLAAFEEAVELHRFLQIRNHVDRLAGEAEDALFGQIKAAMVLARKIVDRDEQTDEANAVNDRVGAVARRAAAGDRGKRFAAGGYPDDDRKEAADEVDVDEEPEA